MTSRRVALLLLCLARAAHAADPSPAPAPMLGMRDDGTAAPELVTALRHIQALSFADPPLPMGVWLHAGTLFVYSYVDSQAGPAVAGEMSMGDPSAPVEAHVITRTGTIGGMTELTDAERVATGLPDTPDWVAGYGPQPPRGSLWGAWRTDPRLAGRFHPDYPDDLQVWIYKGTLKKMVGKPELVWVRLWSCEEETCEGHMLNEPFHIKSMHEGDLIRFGKDGVGDDQFLIMVPREGA